MCLTRGGRLYPPAEAPPECSILRLRPDLDEIVPASENPWQHPDRDFSGQFQGFRLAIPSVPQTMDGDHPVDRMDQPIFPNPERSVTRCCHT